MKDFFSNKPPEEHSFIGEDGKELSSELLQLQMQDALEDENYRRALIIMKELERRKSLL